MAAVKVTARYKKNVRTCVRACVRVSGSLELNYHVNLISSLQMMQKPPIKVN